MQMGKRIFSLASVSLAMALGWSGVARADGDAELRWKEIIGIIQAGNVVAGIAGGGQPWSTLGGHASVDLRSGRIKFRVDGLVFAGGNAIGTPDGIAKVKGTLVCAATTVTPVVVDTPLVELDAEGDAEFDGIVGALPAACSSEPDVAFLVRIAAGRWIANGAVLQR